MMASFSLTTAIPLSSSTLLPKTSSQPRLKPHGFKVSCNIGPNDNEKFVKSSETPKLILPKTSPDLQIVDRRNLLLGLGGLYGAVNLTSLSSAFAVPIAAPEISDCRTAALGIGNIEEAVRGTACCPPESSTPIKEFVFPQEGAVRVRPAAQRATAEYVAKYKAAIQAMRDLPDDHPHSFKQQAKIHCAYCNGGYSQIASGFPDKLLQIHNSWLFFPFHRWYLYFYERILGKLINDPTFALPYWNWDNPTGMVLPAMFEEDGKQNPLFDAFRDVTHLPPAIVNLDYAGTENGASCIDQIGINLAVMYKQMVTTPDTLGFFGGEFRGGDDPINNGDASIGSIEAGSHTAVHRWVGNPRMPNNEDMGNFYSAGYDPVFYVHHANVDRMWALWKGLGSPGHQDPTDPDWLNASYVFYDENEELVRVYNKDSVDFQKLGYDFERSPTPWINSRPTARRKRSNIASKSAGKVKKVEDVTFPLKLDQIVKVLVKRPATNRTKEEKEKVKEVLLVKGIKFDGEKFVKFDVYVNDEDDVTASTAADSEFAGSFAQLQHNDMDKMLLTSGARFGITELLEDIESEGDESVLVTLVPRAGCEDVTIAEITIKLVPLV